MPERRTLVLMDSIFAGQRPVVVGHRGAPRIRHENTPESFAAAEAGGATWVELDARRSADGVVVVHHDPALADGTAIVDLTADQLAVRGVHRLDAVLAGLTPSTGVDVELKNLPGQVDRDEDHALSRMVAAVLASHRTTRPEQPICVTSFDPMGLVALSAADPGVPTGLLHLAEWGMETALEVAVEVGARLLASQVGTPGLTGDGLVAVRAAGLESLVWTVNDPAEWDRLAAIGVDALCTDDPAGLAAHLARA